MAKKKVAKKVVKKTDSVQSLLTKINAVKADIVAVESQKDVDGLYADFGKLTDELRALLSEGMKYQNIGRTSPLV